MKRVTIATIGNPNVGKTTVFNAITGSHQKVGNWPGVTVEKKVGKFVYKNYEIEVVDLPGVYGLTPYSIDQKIAIEFIVNERPDVIVDIVDASNLERNLYLTLQLLEMGARVVMALNMMDLAEEKGYEIDPKALEKELGVIVVPMVAVKGIGIEELKRSILKALEEKPKPIKYPKSEMCIERLASIISSSSELTGKYEVRWLAIKLLEGDEFVKGIMRKSGLWNKIEAKVERIERGCKGLHDELAIAEERYELISSIVSKAVRGRGHITTFTQALDAVLTSRYLGIPIFLALIWMVFKFAFSASTFLMDVIDGAFSYLADWSLNNLSPGWLASLIGDGVLSGLGAVLVFLPPIAFMFIALSILEDSGYLARVAFLMDRIMSRFGLHGKSVIPMIMGFGCNVPAIMATRTIEDERDRILTILVNPLMSCSARLPIYVLFAGIFFRGYEGSVILSIYMLGIALAMILAWTFRKAIFKGKPSPLIMEMPEYLLPNARSVLLHAWIRTSKFLTKAGTWIFLGVIGIWLLSVTGPSGFLGSEALSSPSLLASSWIAYIGKVLQKAFYPMGWDWTAAVALMWGFVAKEIVIGTMGVIYGVGEDGLSSVLPTIFTPVQAYAFMAFTLIYTPCIATVSVIKSEAGWKWAAFSIAYGLVLAWVVAAIITLIGGVFP